jgi:methyl-accepting chemotaxis protein
VRVWGVKLFKKIKVRTKMISAFLFISMLIVVIGVEGLLAMKQVVDNTEKMYSVNLQSVNYILTIKSNLEQINGEILTIMLDKDSKLTRIEAEKKINGLTEKNNTYIDEFEK